MCVVSMIADYGRDRIKPYEWTPFKWNEYKDLMEKARTVDTILDQPECEDEEKKQWMKEIEDRLKAVEDREFNNKLREATNKLQKRIDEAYKEFNLEIENARTSSNRTNSTV